MHRLRLLPPIVLLAPLSCFSPTHVSNTSEATEGSDGSSSGATTETPTTGATTTSMTSATTSATNVSTTAVDSSEGGALCGNGQLDGDEVCDDGDANSDSEPNACRTDCTAAHCGDGVIDDMETC